ncbi:restriction endonuclease subunit S [Nostoc punctiforme UO1]|uniref:restriction endonuclease subunit S n=1 Tax=Nostoc punctiforme TaxID=272131 RepID=UPI00309D081F
MIIDETKTLPHSWQWVKLGDVCDVTKLAGFEYTEHITYSSYGEYIALRAQNVRNYGLDLQKIVYISKETASFLSRSKLNFGDVVMTFIGANIGEATWIDKNDTYYCAPNIAKITPNKKLLYHRFLTRVIHSPIIRQQIEELNKSTAQPSLSMQNIRDFFLPIPPISEQKRIAEILEKCDRLRRTRRYALQLSDTFLQSVFLEIFGDFRKNPYNFPIQFLGDSLDKFESGINFNPVSENDPASQWRVLKVSAVTSGVFNASESKPIKPDVTFHDSLIVKKGDMLMSRANTKELVGAVCIVREQPPKVLLPDKLWRVKFSQNSKLLPNYVLYALRQPKTRKIIADMASGTSGSMKNISKEQAANLPILVPPLPLQEKFAQIVQKFERLRTQQRESERQADHLFQTLLHRAFRGELTSSDFNDEAVSVFSQEISVQQPKPKSPGKVAEYLRTKVNQQETEAVQLTLPGLE